VTLSRSFYNRYDRGEVLAAFTNASFLLFEAFSLCVEALHTLIEPPEEQTHYLVVSAVTNLGVNLVGVLFFRQYARLSVTYRNSQVCSLTPHASCIVQHHAPCPVLGANTWVGKQRQLRAPSPDQTNERKSKCY
jgi:Co/Zn/Cd efflux system component